MRSIDIPRDVSTRPRKTCDVPEADGIGMNGEYDGNRRGRLAGGLIDRHSNQLGGEPRKLLHVFRPSPHDDDIAILDVAEVTETRPQRVDSTILGARPRNPITGTFACGCARAASRKVAAVLPNNAMNSPRLMASPAPRTNIGCEKEYHTSDENCALRYTQGDLCHVRFRSQADHVRFAPESGHC